MGCDADASTAPAAALFRHLSTKLGYFDPKANLAFLTTIGVRCKFDNGSRGTCVLPAVVASADVPLCRTGSLSCRRQGSLRAYTSYSLRSMAVE